MYFRTRGSLVNIVSDYRLDDWDSGVRSQAEAKTFFSSLCAQINSEAHPASCPKGTGGKGRPGRDADYSSPSSVQVKNDKELYSSPMAVARQLY
jgi:hypothetical protein